MDVHFYEVLHYCIWSGLIRCGINVMGVVFFTVEIGLFLVSIIHVLSGHVVERVLRALC